jgi:HK97 family phage major capsid protein
MYGRPMTVKECADQARRALDAGRLDEGEWMLDRAEAIKAGPLALAAFEQRATASLYVGDTVKAIRTERRDTERLDAAMKSAFLESVEAEFDYDERTQKLANELHGGNYAQLCYDKSRAYAKYLKNGYTDRPLASTLVLSPAQIREAVKSGVSAAEVKATMVEAQDTLGGFLVAEAIREEVLGRAATLQVVRSRATIDTAGANGGLGFPIFQGSGDVYPTALRGVWGSETQASSAENPTLGTIKPEIKLWRCMVKTSKSLLEDAGARLANNLNRIFAETVAVAEDAAELTGAGVTDPLGILATSAPGTLSNSDIRVTNSGHATTLTGDGIVNMIYSLPGQYRTAPGYAITMSSATLKVVRSLKDTAGRYIFDPATGTLCGGKVIESESMPAIAANAYPILSGDFAGYFISDKLGLSISRYDDDQTASVDQIWYYLRRRLGGTVGEGWRFGALKVAN